jgi:hypothetical protein
MNGLRMETLVVNGSERKQMFSLYGRCIKHNRNMDVCYVITKAFNTGKKHVLKAFVVNQGYVESYPLDVNIKLTIKLEDLKDWHYCKDVNAKCLRYAEWAQLK